VSAGAYDYLPFPSFPRLRSPPLLRSRSRPGISRSSRPTPNFWFVRRRRSGSGMS